MTRAIGAGSASIAQQRKSHDAAQQRREPDGGRTAPAFIPRRALARRGLHRALARQTKEHVL
jgi:hypothetical protein